MASCKIFILNSGTEMAKQKVKTWIKLSSGCSLISSALFAIQLIIFWTYYPINELAQIL